MTAKVAVIGYASVDYVVNVDGIPQPGRTTTILERPADHWPRVGGSPAYVATAMARCGCPASFPITWIGVDHAGDEMVRRLGTDGVRTEGMARIDGARTPIAIVAYEPGGGCMVLYHPSIRDDLGLVPEQRRIIATSDWLCVTIGPDRVTREALGLLPESTRMCWIVKDDPRAMSADLAARIAGRADIIIHNASEAGFVQKCLAAEPANRPARIIIETRGGDGACVTDGSGTTFVPSQAIRVADPTGAGDTFAGGMLAALAAGESDMVAAIRAGHAAARSFLASQASGRQPETP